MRKILVSFAVVLVILLAASSNPQVLIKAENLFSYSLCDKPIHYRIDTVDFEFELSKDQFAADILDATKIWGKIIGKDLFVYDPKGDLSINLIFDERQSLTNQIHELESRVKTDKQILNPKVDEYKQLSASFTQKLASFKKEVEDWNSQGGASEDVYKRLTTEQKDLQDQSDQLNMMAKGLNMDAIDVNKQVIQLNQTIKTFNNNLTQKPEEGIFKGPENKIEIYFNTSKQGLIHTLAHELGHSIGLEHVNNPHSIMYFKTNKITTPSSDDITALQTICRRHSFFEILKSYISNLKILNLK